MKKRKKCPSCGWPVGFQTVKCPNCNFPVRMSSASLQKSINQIKNRPLLTIGIIVILIIIFPFLQPESIKTERILRKADKILFKSGVSSYDTFCVRDFTRYERHPYIDGLNLRNKENDELSNVSERSNPELYKEIEDKYEKLSDDYWSWHLANKLRQRYLALSNCNSKDKLPEDFQDMKKLGLKMQKIFPKTYKEFPNLKF